MMKYISVLSQKPIHLYRNFNYFMNHHLLLLETIEFIELTYIDTSKSSVNPFMTETSGFYMTEASAMKELKAVKIPFLQILVLSHSLMFFSCECL